MRPAIIDTVATIVFFTVVAGLTELFIARLEPGQVLTTRMLMVPIMLLTGRPYGLWRDWAFRIIRPTTAWSRALIDVVAFVSFQIPVYAATLAIAGANAAQIATALSAAIVFMVALSRPFGLFLDMVRGWAGVAPKP